MLRTILLPLVEVVVILAGYRGAAADQELVVREWQAIRAAVQQVSTAVVEIRPVGGLEKVGRHLVGTGSTTGLIVSEDGHIVSSTLGFVQKPASILVQLPDGRRLAARLIATDHSRKIVLLKVATDQKLPVPVAVPDNQVRVGAWAIAVGRTFAGEQTNLSVGIVSAVDRIFGKVLQTDAKVSPHNYGGPLVDIRGRVLGVLVPIAPQGQSAVAGLEWYDSGIGFAVPLTHINRVLDRLKKGEDLHPGLLGISLKHGNPYLLPAEIAAVQPNSPAQAAGLKSGDRIVEVAGRPVNTQTQFRSQLARRYAGDRIRLAIVRGNQSVACDAVLADRLIPFEHAFIGVLPRRGSAAGRRRGIGIHYVYPGSPAERAGMKIGDVIVALGGKPVAAVGEALAIVNTLSPGAEVRVQVERSGSVVSLRVVTGRLPSQIPANVPAREKPERGAGARPPTGLTELKIPAREQPCVLYVPEDYDPNLACGVLVRLPAPSGQAGSSSPLDAWKLLCDTHGLILVAPMPVPPERWGRAFVDDVRKLLLQVTDTYRVDPTRIVLHGYGAGGTMAYVTALSARNLVRGVAVVDAPLPMMFPLPANDPARRLAVYVARSAKTRFAGSIGSSIKAFRAARYPITTTELGETPRELNADEMADLADWIDSLDRF